MKILIITFFHHGHCLCLCPLLAQLSLHNHQINIVTSVKMQNTLLPYAQSLITYPQELIDETNIDTTRFQPTKIMNKHKANKLFYRFSILTQNLLPWMQDTFKQLTFDLVIYDAFAIWAIPFIKQNNYKSLISIPTFAILPDDPNFNSQEGNQLADQFNQLYNTQVIGSHCIFTGDPKVPKIIYTSQLFQIDVLDPQRYYFTVDHQEKFITKPKPLQNNSLIYVSLGTIFNSNKQLFLNIIEVLHEYQNYNVTISTGQNISIFKDLLSMQLPKNFNIQQWVNQEEQLKNGSIFITHCGFNGVREAIIYGTPMICFPQNADQPLVAERVEQLGLGIYPRQETQTIIQVALETIIKNYVRYFENILQAQQSFKKSLDSEQVYQKIITYVQQDSSYL